MRVMYGHMYGLRACACGLCMHMHAELNNHACYYIIIEVFICMHYTCIHTHICILTYIRCICMHIYLCTYSCMYTYIRSYIYIFLPNARTHLRTQLRMHLRPRLQTRARPHTRQPIWFSRHFLHASTHARATRSGRLVTVGSRARAHTHTPLNPPAFLRAKSVF